MSFLSGAWKAIKSDVAAINYKAAVFIVLNVSSSIGIVVVNKYVFDEMKFKFPTTLTFIHFCFTFFGSVFSVKPIPLLKILPLSLSFCGFVVFTNLSLQYNSVGFYQVMKVMTTPTIVVIQYLLYQKTASKKILYSLMVVCVGVVVTTYSDVSANFIGTMFAVAGVLVTSFYQIWVGSKQKELDANSMQLLYYQAPLSAVILIFVIPIFDSGFGAYDPSVISMAWIVVSGILSIAVNLSIFLLIGNTSPITYNVVGHFKLSFIVMSGFIFFHDPISWQILSGIFITIVGVFWYTHLKLDVQKATRKDSEEEDKPLVNVVVEEKEKDSKNSL